MHQGKLLLLTVFYLFIQQVSAQSITVSPERFRASDEITITCDVTGNSQLEALSDAWAWIWVPGDPNGFSAFTNVNPAGDGQEAVKFTKGENHIWTLKVRPTDIFNESADKITRLGILIKGRDWPDGQSSDVFFDVDQQGVLTVNMTKSTDDMLNVGEQVTFTATASESSHLQISDQHDAVLKEADNVTSLNYTFTAQEAGQFSFHTQATVGDETATASLNVIVKPTVIVEKMPEGLKIGPNYDANDPTKVTFVLQDPAKLKQFVTVIGDFYDNAWAVQPNHVMKLDDTGDANYWWLTVTGLEPGKEYLYQYLLDGSIKIADPYADKISDPSDQYIDDARYPNLIPYPADKTDKRASFFQTNQQAYQWSDATINFQKPEKSALMVYELHLRDFTKEQTYDAAIKKLDYIKSLGINCIELMPVNEFEGNSSWGYNPNFYFAVDKWYGSKNELKRFIDEAHERGMAVVIDMVLNHSFHSSPFVRMYNHGDYGDPTSDNPWYNEKGNFIGTDLNWGADFNHESIWTKQLVDSVNTYWMDQYKVDGFRFDFTKGFTNEIKEGADKWGSRKDDSRIAILKRMYQKIEDFGTNAYVILEHLTDWDEEAILAKEGMLLWTGAGPHHEFVKATQGNNANLIEQYYGNRTGDGDLEGTKALVSYMESHDEERLKYEADINGEKVNAYDLTKEEYNIDRLKLMSAFFVPVPGPKMIWQFGELGYDVSINQIEKDGDVSDDYRTGEKPVMWEYNDAAENPERVKLRKVYTALMHLRSELKLYDASKENTKLELDDNNKIKVIHLKNAENVEVHIVGNFGMQGEEVPAAKLPNGTWYDYFSNGKEVTFDGQSNMLLGPGNFKVYINEPLNDYPEEGLINTALPFFKTNPGAVDKNKEATVIFYPAGGNQGLINTDNAKMMVKGIFKNPDTEATGSLDLIKVGDRFEGRFVPNTLLGLSDDTDLIGMEVYFENENGEKALDENDQAGLISFSFDRVTFNPENWRADAEVTIHFDFHDKKIGEEENLYLWSWIENHENEKIDNGAWEQSSENAKLTNLGHGQYEIKMVPTAYFHATASQIKNDGLNFLVKTKEGGMKSDNFGPFKSNLVTAIKPQVPEAKVFPNPTSGILHISNLSGWEGNVGVRVMNSFGQQLYFATYHANQQGEIVLDLSSYASGQYIIQLYNEHKRLIKKIIKL